MHWVWPACGPPACTKDRGWLTAPRPGPHTAPSCPHLFSLCSLTPASIHARWVPQSTLPRAEADSAQGKKGTDIPAGHMMYKAMEIGKAASHPEEIKFVFPQGCGRRQLSWEERVPCLLPESGRQPVVGLASERIPDPQCRLCRVDIVLGTRKPRSGRGWPVARGQRLLSARSG